jgi:hypothetical protein
LLFELFCCFSFRTTAVVSTEFAIARKGTEVGN